MCLKMFDGVDWSNLFVAGGSILGCLTSFGGNRFDSLDYGFHNADIDIFIHGLNPEEATKKIFDVCEKINKNVSGCGKVLISQQSVTLLGLYPVRHVQFILRLYR